MNKIKLDTLRQHKVPKKQRCTFKNILWKSKITDLRRIRIGLRGSCDPVYYLVINSLSRDVFSDTVIVLSDIDVNCKYLRWH